MGKKKKSSLQQAARAALAEKYGLKNNKNASYWIVACPLKGKEWLFDSDWRLDHYYLCESDPDVLTADYSLRRLSVIVEGVAREVRFDARVERDDGTMELRRVQSPAQAEEGDNDALEKACSLTVAAEGARYRRVTIDELDQHAQRLANWRRGYRFWRAERAQRPSELATATSDVRLRLEQRRQLTLQQLADGLPNLGASLTTAAAMSLLRQRSIRSDMDRVPFGGSILFTWGTTP